MFAGVKTQIEAFKQLGLPQWFRIVTAIVQYIGVAGLIVGFWLPCIAGWSGVWLGITMLAAVFFHIKVKEPFSKAVPALVLALLALVLIWLNASSIPHPF
ncbi:hypothetical protein GCM10010917_06850 [Paenibacillus physcomitrellae]|uniref:DoxX family protein n=2 Tax=Paenibacillus physcomitrellae TaxID=1619311 RepID=A0ABQ1FPY3_9BACL|nr:hypothetical protein GCM10010917_06850 [Paenibacillus physcomitrellae]